MRYSAAEKREIIHLVEHSDLPVKQTLEEPEVPRSSFYHWYPPVKRLRWLIMCAFGLIAIPISMPTVAWLTAG